jgi:hypothetical protein
VELSHTHRFIFVHVYRTGGQSVSQALRPYSFVPRGPLTRVPFVRRYGKGRFAALREANYGHLTALELRAALPAEVFDSYYKFAFVRNPWDWHVSIYHYVRQLSDHPDHELFTSFDGFDRYLDWRIRERGPELQSSFVLDDSGAQLVDFIGRHETFGRDFATVCQRIGVECSLPHKNRSSHRDFRDYYTPQTRALVAEVYRKDIELFGYEF